MKKPYGKLIGASLGPGDPELITRRSWAVLQSDARWIYPVKKAAEVSYALSIVERSGLPIPADAVELPAVPEAAPVNVPAAPIAPLPAVVLPAPTAEAPAPVVAPPPLLCAESLAYCGLAASQGAQPVSRAVSAAVPTPTAADTRRSRMPTRVATPPPVPVSSRACSARTGSPRCR